MVCWTVQFHYAAIHHQILNYVRIWQLEPMSEEAPPSKSLFNWKVSTVQLDQCKIKFNVRDFFAPPLYVLKTLWTLILSPQHVGARDMHLNDIIMTL